MTDEQLSLQGRQQAALAMRRRLVITFWLPLAAAG
jgi:hypothetical protein